MRVRGANVTRETETWPRRDRDVTEGAQSYAKEVLDLMEELLSLEDGGTPKKIIKLWSKPMSK